MKPPRSMEAGYAYQEMLVALALFGVAMTSVAPLYLLSARRGVEARDLVVATALAEARVEELRAQPLASLASGSDLVRAAGREFARSWTVRHDHPHPTLSTVTVQVLARGPGRRAATATLSFRAAERAR